MSKVISDSLYQVVRASQLGDVIISNKLPTAIVTPLFTVILNIDFSIALMLTTTNSHAIQNPNTSFEASTIGSFAHLESVPSFDPGTNIAESFSLSTTFANALQAPDFSKELSTQGSFQELNAVPSFTVT